MERLQFERTNIGGTGNDVVLTQLTETQRPWLGSARAGVTNILLWWATNRTGRTTGAACGR